jgi:hypothetical protein
VGASASSPLTVTARGELGVAGPGEAAEAAGWDAGPLDPQAETAANRTKTADRHMLIPNEPAGQTLCEHDQPRRLAGCLIYAAT